MTTVKKFLAIDLSPKKALSEKGLPRVLRQGNLNPLCKKKGVVAVVRKLTAVSY